MLVIPAIDIIDGQCVRLTQGDYSRKTVYDSDPVAMAQQFAEEGERQPGLPHEIIDAMANAREETCDRIGLAWRIDNVTLQLFDDLHDPLDLWPSIPTDLRQRAVMGLDDGQGTGRVEAAQVRQIDRFQSTSPQRSRKLDRRPPKLT